MKKTGNGHEKGAGMLTVFLLAQRLMRGSRGKLYFLLALLTLFQAEAPLMMPLILKQGFQAVAEGDMRALLGAAVFGICIFLFNFAIMYFLNVYGDAWVTKFAFHAAGNCFRELRELPLASLQAEHNDDDLFNRIAAGTGNIMGFYFSLANLLGNGAAVVALAAMLYSLSDMLGVLLILLMAAELAIVRLQLRCNASYTRKLQTDKAESIRRARCLLEQLSFHQHNRTWDWMRGLYGTARAQWFRTQEKRMLTGICLDSCRAGIHGLFKTGLVYSFMAKQELFLSYADDLAASFSAFQNLADKTKAFASTVSGLPNSYVPIGKLDEVLASQPPRIAQEAADSLTLEHLSVAIGEQEILRDVCCRIPLGKNTAIIGENGSGKSTLLKAIAGLYQCNGGKVICFNQKMAYAPADELLFQGHSIEANISYGKQGIPAKNIKELLKALLFRDVEELCQKTPSQLSGGEAKRINIARALLSDADVILADEPTSCLDSAASGRVMEMLLGLKGKTVIYITHDLEYAGLADIVIHVHNGKARQTDAPFSKLSPGEK